MNFYTNKPIVRDIRTKTKYESGIFGERSSQAITVKGIENAI